MPSINKLSIELWNWKATLFPEVGLIQVLYHMKFVWTILDIVITFNIVKYSHWKLY